MHKLMHIPPQDNPTSAMLTPQASFMLQRAPLLAIGTLDDASRPWTTLWGGNPGFSEPIGGGFVGTRTLVDEEFDPVVRALVGGGTKGEMLQPKDGGKMVSGLAIDLVTRKRVKIAGKMAAGTLREVDIESEGDIALPSDVPSKQTQIQLVTKIEESLGNCPKYLNQYELKPALVTPKLLNEGPTLSPEARALIDKSDMFFLSSTSPTSMDTNHRGGPPGFVRTISPTCIIYPEYSGNRLYQSLGNLQLNPLIGVTFPDYETGDVLYTTGTAEILIGAAAAQLMPGTNLAVKIHLTHTLHVHRGLPFRGTLVLDGRSPYNPLLRTLASEGNVKAIPGTSTPKTAVLVDKTVLAPSVARFTFKVDDGIEYNPGQWVALGFKDELDIGYSHMRNDDPRSLNDDFVRTFTISSTPSRFIHDGDGNGDGDATKANTKDTHFAITIRRIGPATSLLFAQNPRAGFSLPVLGVGGDFNIVQPPTPPTTQDLTTFIAAGVGITPLLGQLASLDVSPARFVLFWTVRREDVGLVADTLERYPGLGPVTRVFVTGGGDSSSSEDLEGVKAKAAEVYERRLGKEDLESVSAKKWFLCAGREVRKVVLGWAGEREVVFEGFDY